MGEVTTLRSSTTTDARERARRRNRGVWVGVLNRPRSPSTPAPRAHPTACPLSHRPNQHRSASVNATTTSKEGGLLTSKSVHSLRTPPMGSQPVPPWRAATIAPNPGVLDRRIDMPHRARLTAQESQFTPPHCEAANSGVYDETTSK